MSQNDSTLEKQEVPAAKAAGAAGAAKHKQHSRGKTICLIGFVLALCALSTHWLSRAYLIFDFFNNLTLQYGLAAAAFAIGYIMPRARVLTAIVLIIAGLLTIAAWPHYVSDRVAPAKAALATEKPLKLMTFNTWSRNTDWQAVVEEIKRHDADIVTMIEFGHEKKKAFDALLKTYPHSIHCMAERYCHLALMSKVPLTKIAAKAIWQGPAYIHVRLGTNYGKTHVFALHSTRPPHVRSQIVQLTTMARHLKKFSGPKIVMGDFNSTPYATLLQKFTASSGLNRLTNLPTYPTHYGPFAQIAIDHVFLSDDVRPLSEARTGSNAGSDHYPVIVDVAVPGRE